MPVYPVYRTDNIKGTYFQNDLYEYFITTNKFQVLTPNIYVMGTKQIQTSQFTNIFQSLLGIFDNPVSGIDVYYRHGEFDIEKNISNYKFFDNLNFCFYLSNVVFKIHVVGIPQANNIETNAFMYYGSAADIRVTNLTSGLMNLYFVTATEGDDRIVTEYGDSSTKIKVGSVHIDTEGYVEFIAGNNMVITADNLQNTIIFDSGSGTGGTTIHSAFSQVKFNNLIASAEGEDTLEFAAGTNIQMQLDQQHKKLIISALDPPTPPEQDRFKSIKVGNSIIESDLGDTLELIAGSNITIVPDIINKSVTISAQGISNIKLERETFELTDTDIANKYIYLSYTPQDQDDVILYIVSAGVQTINLDFGMIEGNKLTWEGYNLDTNILSTGDVFDVVYAHVL